MADETSKEWLRYSNQSAKRNQPINQKLKNSLSFLGDMGVTMEVYSGGQMPKGTPGHQHVGSTRHDHGNSADVFFYKDGKRLDWNDPADVPVYQQIVKNAKANGVTGFGAGPGYMARGSMHIGFGAPSVWGKGGKGANAPQWLRDVYAGAPIGQSPGGANNLPGSLIVPGAQPVPSYLSSKEERTASQQAAADRPSVLGGARDAIKSEWAGSYALAQLNADEFEPDDNFTYDEETWKGLTDGVPEPYLDVFDDAVSLAHARALRSRVDEMVATDERLGSLGGAGTALRIGAAVLDPVAIGASILTEGAAAPIVYGTKIARVSRALRYGAVAGANNAAVEGYIASQNPTRGALDILLAGTTGLAVGGALGHFVPSRIDHDLSKAARSMEKEFEMTAGPAGSSVGAKFVGEGPTLTAAEAQLLNAGDAPKSALGKARIDMVGQLKQSEHPIVRKLAGYLAEDGVGNADNSVLVRSASENVTHAMKVRMTKFYRTAEPAFRDWIKANNIPLWKRASYRESFFEEVGKAVRRPADMYTADPHINKVSLAMKDAQRDLLRFAKEKGIRGFEEVSENTEYLMRVFHHRKLDELTQKFGEGNLNRVVAKAIVKGSDDIDYEDALDISKAYLKSIRSQKYQDVQLSRVFSEDQADLLEGILKEEGTISSERIASITRSVRKPQQTDAPNNRAKRRLQLDETYRETFRDGKGNQMTVGMEDFLDSNAERLMTLYTRQIAGAGFMEEALSHFKVPRADGTLDDKAPSIETILRHIRETATGSPSKVNEEVSKLEVLYKAVMGIPLKKADKAGEALRLIRDFNFIRVMNQVGFAQIAEIGNIMGHAGIRETMQHVPAMRNIWKRAKDGSLSDDLLDEIEVIWGIGTDRLRHTAANRMDDYGVYEGAGIGKADNALQAAKHITADISLMAPVNMALQRMAGRAAIQRFMNMATGGKTMSKQRLASLGLDPAMGKRVSDQMNKHVYAQEGVLGRTVKRLNIDEWDDAEAASAFIQAIDRWSRTIIQENDIGQMSRWMTSDLGKNLVQFRSFMVAAWTKQTLKGVQMRDWDTFVAWSTSTFFAGMSYIAQTQINSVGRADRDDYIEKRLSLEAIGKSAFQRAGYATIVPGAADTVLTLAGYEPAFAYGRTTGLASTSIMGNPSFDLMDKSFAAIKGGVSATLRDDYQYSQQDFRALTSVLPFQNAMVIRNIYQMMGGNLPRFSE